MSIVVGLPAYRSRLHLMVRRVEDILMSGELISPVHYQHLAWHLATLKEMEGDAIRGYPSWITGEDEGSSSLDGVGESQSGEYGAQRWRDCPGGPAR